MFNNDPKKFNFENFFSSWSLRSIRGKEVKDHFSCDKDWIKKSVDVPVPLIHWRSEAMMRNIPTCFICSNRNPLLLIQSMNFPPLVSDFLIFELYRYTFILNFQIINCFHNRRNNLNQIVIGSFLFYFFFLIWFSTQHFPHSLFNEVISFSTEIV